MSIHCTACGVENLDSAPLCLGCGAPLEAHPAEALIGQTLFDSYEVVKVLGQGGMAVVYLGRNRLTEQLVAIKMLPPELAAYPDVKTRFLEEARTLARLEHPNIVHLINFAEDQGRLCLVMQYAEGVTFESMIEEQHRVDGAEAVRICCGVLEALGHAHQQGVVHRDIKPSNVMVKPDGKVKVTDFGIAKMTRETKLTQTGQTMGTVRYMAPEQVRGKGIDPRTDLYSLGISIYEAVVGSPPFDGESQFEVMQMHLVTPPAPPRDCGADISPELEAVILRSLAKPQEERYQTAAEFRAALLTTPEGRKSPPDTHDRLAISSAPTAIAVAARTAASRPESAPARPSRWVWIVAGAIVLAAVGITAWLVASRRSAGTAPSGPAAGAGAPSRDARAPRAVVLPARHEKLDAVAGKVKTWAVSHRFPPPHQAHLLADRPVDTGQLGAGYEAAQAAYRRLLQGSGASATLRVRPLTLVLVDVQWLNDRTIWPDIPLNKVAENQLLAVEGIAFAASNKGDLNHQIRYSVGLHLCPPELKDEDCQRLAEKLEQDGSIVFFAPRPR